MSLRILQKQNPDVTSQNSAAFTFPGQKWEELARKVLLTQPLAQNTHETGKQLCESEH